ncbi:hypothetical protein C8J56DRAFT_1087393 [Mycena floridula]|nr:hypothetical protein C8J56DRAFT_1087393 [Mycena floridula]
MNKDLLAIESQIKQEKESPDCPHLWSVILSTSQIQADGQPSAVHSASWVAAYDIRADLENEKKPITMIYKADWNDVPLILETATPSFGAGIPTLTTCNLSISPPYAFMRKESAIRDMRASNSAPGGNEKSRRRTRRNNRVFLWCTDGDEGDIGFVQGKRQRYISCSRLGSLEVCNIHLFYPITTIVSYPDKELPAI